MSLCKSPPPCKCGQSASNICVARALSSHALEALAQFNSERDARVKEFETLKAQVEERASKGAVTIESFTEDWNESQFWVKAPFPLQLKPILPRMLATKAALSRPKFAFLCPPACETDSVIRPIWPGPQA